MSIVILVKLYSVDDPIELNFRGFNVSVNNSI